MGRGRAKAKQVKVARQLKYGGGGTDLDRLRAELGVGSDQRDDARESAYDDFADHSDGEEDDRYDGEEDDRYDGEEDEEPSRRDGTA
jgi:Protein of unknown function (DUF3073)